MYDILYLFRGIVVGLMVSIPLGPMGVLIIQKTLNRGGLAGFIAGMGVASADLFYAVVAAFGLGFIVDVVNAHVILLQVLGGVFLMFLGLSTYFANPLKRIKNKRRITKKGLVGDFLSLFFLTVSNPVAIIVFMAVFAGMSVFGEQPSFVVQLLVLAGVFMGGSLWWYVLTLVVNAFRKKFRLRLLITVNKVAGVVIAVLGGILILASFEPFSSFIRLH